MTNEGAIGNLTGIDIIDAWPKDNADFMNKDHWYHKLPGGVFGEILPHPIYLAISFLGKLEPVAVYARKLSSYEWVIADELRVILEGEKGTGMITASCNWPKGGATLDVFGMRRNLHVDIHSGVLTKSGAGGESHPRRALDNLSQAYQLLACTTSTAFNTMMGRHLSGHHTLIAKFVESIRNDTKPPVTGEEGKEVVRVLESITAQMNTGPRTG
jgi:predicted dehydrogenase